MRRESAPKLENPLNLKQKRLLDMTCEIYCFFFLYKISHFYDPEYVD